MVREAGVHQKSRFRLGITLGDPGGVGPEIIAKALPVLSERDFIPVVFGHRRAIEGYLSQLPSLTTKINGDLSRFEFIEPEVQHHPVPLGTASAAGGKLSLAYVEQAIENALKGEIDGVVTAPVSKESWAMAGSHYRGHTILFQDRCGVPRSVMMLLNPRLRVSLVTHHVPLREVPAAVTADRVEETIRMTADGVAAMGIPSPRIAVAGLNPHAGEEGLLGTEDGEQIAPAVQTCRNAGINVRGPFPADTVFHRAVAGEFDAVVAMYHDQGLTPLKTLSFADTVNVTLGLPIIRTSVGHGTAFDIAGQGIADPASLLEAVSLAGIMARCRRERSQPG
jgi:4-hydroxythreonine-4-phosphate dehydrogenase